MWAGLLKQAESMFLLRLPNSFSDNFVESSSGSSNNNNLINTSRKNYNNAGGFFMMRKIPMQQILHQLKIRNLTFLQHAHIGIPYSFMLNRKKYVYE